MPIGCRVAIRLTESPSFRLAVSAWFRVTSKNLCTAIGAFENVVDHRYASGCRQRRPDALRSGLLDWLRIRVQKPGALVRLLERFLEEARNYIIVLQHADCGITRLAGVPSMLKRYFQIQDGELKTKAVTDPRAAVAVDVAMLRAIPALLGEWLVSGLVYEVAIGLVEIVVPPARVRGTLQSVNSQPCTSKSWF